MTRNLPMIRNLLILLVPFLGVSCSDGPAKTPLTDKPSTAKSQEVETVIIDVRTLEEYQQGHLKNALLIPYNEIETQIVQHVTDKKKRIMVYCRSGRRSGIAQEVLLKMGYTNTVNGGGYEALKSKAESVE